MLLLTPEGCSERETVVSADDRKWIADNGAHISSHTLTLDYEHYSSRAVLSAVLPQDTDDVPSAYETVGHIAHFNLRKELLPYRAIIGSTYT